MDQGIRGDLQGAASLLQASGLRRVPARIQRLVPRQRLDMPREHRLVERGRLFQGVEAAAPEAFQRTLVLALQPFDELAVATIATRHLPVGVELQHFTEQP
ncbi:hypothetical protein D3C84_1051400 [compost metagenome]